MKITIETNMTGMEMQDHIDAFKRSIDGTPRSGDLNFNMETLSFLYALQEELIRNGPVYNREDQHWV